MRVLLDENIDRLLKGLFAPEFTVLTVQERGWRGKANGELLRAAQQEFDVLVTMDRNLEHQHLLTAAQYHSTIQDRFASWRTVVGLCAT